MNSVYSRNVKKALKQLSRGVLSKSCSENMLNFTGEHSCRSVISIKLLCNFIEIALWHGCSPVNLLNIFRTTFSKNTSGWLLLKTHTNQSIQQAFLHCQYKNNLQTFKSSSWNYSWFFSLKEKHISSQIFTMERTQSLIKQYNNLQ